MQMFALNGGYAIAASSHPRVAGVRLWFGITALCLGLLQVPVHAETLPGQDKTFITRAAEFSNAEIQASKLALEKTSNPDVKTFAGLMLDDHSTLRDDLKKLAASKDVAVPDKPGMSQRARIVVLGKLHGATFDKQYLSMMGVSAQHDALKLFRQTADEGIDPDVKNFAARIAPGLQHHLDMAGALKDRLDAMK